jgi:hypothetical protein
MTFEFPAQSIHVHDEVCHLLVFQPDSIADGAQDIRRLEVQLLPGLREVSGGGRGMPKHMTPIPPMPSTGEEWLLGLVEQLPGRNAGETAHRIQTDDGSVLLTDFQRAALRWLSSFD